MTRCVLYTTFGEDALCKARPAMSKASYTQQLSLEKHSLVIAIGSRAGVSAGRGADCGGRSSSAPARPPPASCPSRSGRSFPRAAPGSSPPCRRRGSPPGPSCPAHRPWRSAPRPRRSGTANYPPPGRSPPPAGRGRRSRTPPRGPGRRARPRSVRRRGGRTPPSRHPTRDPRRLPPASRCAASRAGVGPASCAKARSRPTAWPSRRRCSITRRVP